MKFYEKNKRYTKSISFRIQRHINETNIPLDIIKPVSHSKIPPWKLLKPEIDTSLTEFRKTEANPVVFKEKVAEFKVSKQTGIEIYTDGPKDKNKMAAAAVINKDVFSARLQDEATIFSTEAKAIELAFEYIKMFKYTYFTIF